MSGFTEETRQAGIATPLGEDVLFVRGMTGEERVSRPYRYHVDLLSEDTEINFADIVGHPVCVWVELADQSRRFFHGIVSRFRHVGASADGIQGYQAEIRPWLWLLSKSANCRIYQNTTVPDLLTSVFGDLGFSDCEVSLQREYREWEYCVQYRETDFNFVCRLMEQEGIYYYFKHEENRHVLALADDISAHEPFPGYETITFRQEDAGPGETDNISAWTSEQSVQPGAYVMRDFDFARPRTDLTAMLQQPRETGFAEFEMYDYPGEYLTAGDGEAYARLRLEEHQAEQAIATGRGRVRGIAPGCRFSLDEFPRDDQNREYLVIAARYRLRMPEFTTGGTEGDLEFSCSFSAVSSERPYRTPRVTPKPVVQGPQTAIVVGPSGEEIWTDEHGRVKVQFHWDREGGNDENSSCWIRVSQQWAGRNWGGIAIPRIGQEVIVEFLEGDPDRPIITGRVYNGDNQVPYALPDNQTQSGVKSRSSKQGSPDDFNELRFEDKKDEEEIYFHAEKDFNRVVENDDTLKVGFDDQDKGDQTIEIYHDQSLTVGNNRTVKVGHDLEDPGNQSIDVKNNQSVKVGGSNSRSIGGKNTDKIGKDNKVTVGGSETYEIEDGDQTLTVSADRTVTIGGNDTLTVDQGDHTVTVSAGGAKLEAMQAIELKVGESSIKIEPAQITIKAAMITIEATGMMGIKAPMTEVKGDGMLTLKGGLTLIN